MTLQRKLMAAFGALATIALLVAVTALYLTLGWQDAAAQAERHYRRSLLLQSIRADTFQALKEVDDALTGDVRDARDDFERILAPAQRHFREWQALADTSDEREEIARVRNGYDNLVAYARRVFELLPMDRAAAEKLIDLEIDTRAHEQFRVLTENGVQADGRKRDEIGAETRRVRTTTQVMLAVSMVSILSLTLLLAGFIAQDLFRPLRAVRETLERLYRGDLKARAEEGRDDEIGAVARSLNLWAGEVERRLHLLPASGMAFPPELSLERVDLSTLLHESLARHRDELARRCVGVELAPTPGACVVLADRDRLREALELLLRQALASLPERGGRLGIRTLPSLEPPGFVRLEVADDGPGMDDQQRRLALGEMDEDGATPPTPGFAPVRALADRLGGRMALYSEPGRGSVVQLLLPCG